MPLLNLKNISINITQKGMLIPILKNINLALNQGEILAIVGESGCGKSTLCKLIPGLLYANYQMSGKMTYRTRTNDEITITELNNRNFQTLRGSEIGFIFQNAVSSINPVLRCGTQLMDLIEDNAKKSVLELLNTVGLSDPERIFHSYPHQLSGGMVQRFALALALAKNPAILIADEPVSSLDATSKSQYLKLLKRLNTDRGLTIIFVTHDIDDALFLTDQITILYAGQIVETGSVATIKNHPAHPYTYGLISIARAFRSGTMPTPIPGESPALTQPISGCPFHPRCFNAQESCKNNIPAVTTISKTQFVSCHFPVKTD